MSKNFTRIKDGINLANLTADPVDGVKGDMYFNTSSNTIKIHDGTTFQDEATQAYVTSAISAIPAAPVDSVNGQVGVVVLDTDDINEGVTNEYFTNARAQAAIDLTPYLKADGSVVLTSDLSAAGHLITNLGTPVLSTDSTNKNYVDTADNLLIPLSQKAAANGVATLDAGGQVPSSQIPALAITDTFVVANQAARLALTAQVGDVAVETDNSTTYILQTSPASVNANWVPLLTPPSAVTSVNTQTGNVVLTTDNVSEGSTNLYFTNARAIAAVNLAPYLKADGTVAMTGDLNANTHKIINAVDPTNPQDVATKAYVDTTAATGANTTLSNLTSPTAINQSLVPSGVGSQNLGSGVIPFNRSFITTTNTDKITTVAGNGSVQLLNTVNMSANNISSMADPLLLQDASTKAYTDASGGATFIVSASGTTTLTAASPRLTIVTGTLAQTILLPSTAVQVIGETWNITNRSTLPITVKDSTNTTTLAVLPTDQNATLTVRDTATQLWFSRIFLTLAPATGNVSIGNKQLTNVAGPALATDGANKNYVDNAGFRNLISNGTAEITTSNIFTVTKNTTPGPRPDNGFVVGGTSLTTSITTTNPLRDNASFLLTKPAVNAQGDQASISFAVPLELRAKAIQITLPYIVNSGTFVAGDRTTDSDAIIYIYDVTNSTFIEPSNIKFLSNNSSLSDSVQATFQTSATGSSYKLLVHVATTSAVAWELKVDDIVVGPQNYQYGTPVTDGTSYIGVTSGTAFGTIASQEFTYSRNGDRATITGTFTAGNSGGASGRINTPGTIDASKMGTQPHIVGRWQRNNGNASSIKAGVLMWFPASNIISLQNDDSGFGVNGFVDANVNSFLGNNEQVTVYIPNVYISGWSSSVQTSDQTDTRVVAGSFNTAVSQVLNNGDRINFNTIEIDTHGSVTTGVGAWQYRIPVAGIYNFTAAIYVNVAQQVALNLVKNGTTISVAYSPSTGGQTLFLSKETSCIAGDIIYFTYANGSGSMTLSVGSAANFASIERISGPSAIAASETIAAKYTDVSGGTLATSPAIYKFQTKDYDTHNAYSSATGLYTVPIAGKYEICSNMYAIVNLNSTQHFYLQIYLNGSFYSFLNLTTGNGATAGYSCQGSDIISCNAGDTLAIWPTSDTSTTASTVAGVNRVTFKRIGL